MERLFKFHDELLHYEIAVREENVIPRLVKLHQELVRDSDVALYRRVEQFLSVLLIAHIDFDFRVVYDKTDLPY